MPSAFQSFQATPLAAFDPWDFAVTNQKARKNKHPRKKLQQLKQLLQSIHLGRSVDVGGSSVFLLLSLS